ncbi:tetratricopeptide repeat protein [Photobacterium kasasachensis]|uniref:tetratricopeptide repeat protein n=1 Tax=Photobacterium kasasachensis TaxID=2910240 RepID=UPI003D132E48
MDVSEQYKRYKKYLEFDAENTQLLAQTIEFALKANDFNGAWELAVRAMQEHSEDLSCRYQAITTAIATHKYNEAISWLSATISTDQPPVWALYNYVYSLLQLGDYDGVIGYVDSIQVQLEEIPQIMLLKARALHFNAEYTACEEALVAYLSSNPEDAEALGCLSLVLLDMGTIEQAELTGLKALELNAKQFESLLTMATIKLAQHDPKKALAYAEQALSIAPNAGRALTIKGQLLLIESDYEQAMVVFEKAIETIPSHIGTWHGLAWCYLLSDQYDKSERAFENALQLDHNFAESHGGLALVCAIQNKFDDADEHLARALRLNRRCFTGLFARAMILRKRGKDKEADKIITAILKSPAAAGALPLREVAGNLISKLNESFDDK